MPLANARGRNEVLKAAVGICYSGSSLSQMKISLSVTNISSPSERAFRTCSYIGLRVVLRVAGMETRNHFLRIGE